MYALILTASLFAVTDMEPAYIIVPVKVDARCTYIMRLDGAPIAAGQERAIFLPKGGKRTAKVTITIVNPGDGTDQTTEFQVELEAGYITTLPITVKNWKPFDVIG